MTKIAPLADSASLFFAQAPAPAGNPLMSMLPMILIFGAMYFFMIAPQRKKQKEHQKMLEALNSGDEVVTAGGIYGEITNKKDDRYVIRIAEGTKIEVGKAFIASLVRKSGEEKK
ncbi:preprotein translocase subunit YajC [Nibricoccus aquaticus]|uniref:Sec translocon accessory complex subunit YajC n=1 Tax=Nibricoccus aquaticus TaxID=2576891 RepID=A0A290Q648_9BACT|nr:preprotein translocase subunit YajC [Nibricoccus aquaticus]ATC62660.1 preprotein translocase subunit YajC [Nibricoccus aquaticus]